jgi:hypothetical protein
MEQTFTVGSEAVIEAPAPTGPYMVVFEDDGDTGYFYAVDTSRDHDDQVLDATAIYNVEAVTDRHKPATFTIRWAAGTDRAALFVNGHAHAVFDFASRRGYSRLNFPATSRWSTQGHAWDEQALTGIE